MTVRPIAMHIVPSPTVLAPNHARPTSVHEVTLRQLCDTAEIPCRVTLGYAPKIVLHSGAEHYRSLDTYFVGGCAGAAPLKQVSALRVLEALAYGFFDYGARESVCGRGLFVAAASPGRPRKHGRAMTSAERMRAMRGRVARG